MRTCIGQQPFKYFVETDPTVPLFVKKITLDDIQNWNTVLNKQDKLTAGQHIIIDNNVISFDHTIDELASDFNYFKIGEERLYNDLRNYFTTINEEEFIPIDILSDTAFMQWQDGLYYLTGDFDIDNEYKVVKNNVEYDVLPYWDRATGDPQAFIDLIKSLGENETLAYYKEVEDEQTHEKEIVRETLSIQEDGSEEYLADSDGIFDEPGDERINALFEVKEFVIYNTYTASVVKTVYVLSDYDIRNPEEVELTIIVKLTEHNKVQPTDEFDSDATYYVYNRKTDTYTQISLTETTFKQRQNGLYIRNAYWQGDTLLTAKNIDQFMYDIVDTAYSKKAQNAYSNFVTNELKQYVTGRISSLNLSNYATTTALTNLNDRFNVRDVYYNDKIAKINELSSTREYLITTGNGLKKTYVNEGTLNQVAHLDLDIRRIPDGDLNEEVKKYLHLEDGYNGFYIFNDLIYQDWQYLLDANGNYIPDGEGGWQKEQLDHYVIGMPFTERLVPARVAVSSRAVLEELNDNYEMKLITLGSNVQIVDLAYYKQLWGATGATFTEADFKALTAEWYDVNWDYDTPENQAIMKMYTYNGENGERLYRHQRAITFIPSESGDIYAADDEGTEIGSSVVQMYFKEKKDAEGWQEYWYAEYDEQGQIKAKHRKETVWKKDSNNELIYVPEDEAYDNSETYYLRGSIASKYTVPSSDGVAKFVESLDLDYTGGKIKLSITERPNTINERVVNIDEVTIVDDTTKSTNTTWSSNKIDTEITNAINALDVTEVGGTNKYISAISEADGKISATVGDIDTSVTSDSSNLITSGAVAAAIDALPEPMIFKGSVGSGGTVEWANLPSASSSNKGWTYKVITDNNSAPICKVGDTIISDATEWIVIPSGDEPSGTVTSIGLIVPTGLQVSNSPITSSGTLAITYATGYSIPTDSQQTTWTNKIAGVQLNGTDLTIDANKKVNVIVPQVYRFV